jgi:phage-related protein
MGAEAFTILAVLEARDRASAVIERLDGSMNGLASSMTRAAEATRVAGAGIDESLLQTASGEDAVELASARLSAARAKQGAATDAAANAERELLAVQQEIAAAGDADAAMTGRQVAAVDALTAAQKRAAKAALEVADAEKSQASVAEASAARSGEAAAAADVGATAQRRLGTEAGSSAGLLTGASKAMTMVALAGGAVAAVSVKAAGDFQSATQHLVTEGGEAQSNLAMIQKGILGIASATGTTATQLTAAMLHIESSGFHGAQGLKLLTTAAEGAKVGGADFDTVAKTLTGTMNSYNMSGDQSATMMNQLIASVAAGDMKMQDFASSLGNVAPLAAAAGLSFDQVGGAVATMTSQNMSAQQATQDLSNTILSLQKPSGLAVTEMQNLGLNANDVSEHLGSRGLAGTLDMLTKAVAAHTQGGEVLVSALKDSRAAANDANIALKQLPPSLQSTAKGLLDGSVTAKEWGKDIAGLGPAQRNLAQQFLTMVKHTESFNNQLRSGSPAAQTYNAAMATMLNGSTGLKTALMLTGDRMSTFQANVNAVADAAKKGGGQVADWDKIQGTFNQKMDVAKASLQAAGISIGTVLLPAVSKAADVIAKVVVPMAAWIQSHQTLVGIIATLVGAITAGVIAAKLLTPVIEAVIAVTELWTAAQAGLDVAMDANPIGLITIAIEVLIAAIVAIVAGLIYAWNHFKWFHDGVTAAVNGVKEAGVALWHGLEAAWKGIVAGAEWVWHALEAAWDAVKGKTVALAHDLAAVWDDVTSTVSSAWGTVKSFTLGLWHDLDGIWHKITGAVTTAWNTVESVTTTVWNAISGFFKKWWPLLVVIFTLPVAILMAAWNHFHTAVFSTATETWNRVSKFLSGLWDGITSTAAAAWGLFVTYVITPLQQLWDRIVAGWETSIGWLSARWADVQRLAAQAWDLVKTYVITPMQQLWGMIVSGWNATVSWLSGIWGTVQKEAASAWSLIYQYIVQPAQRILSDLGSIFSSIGTTIWDGLTNALQFVVNIGDNFLSVGQDIVMGIVHGIEDAGSYLYDTLKNLAGNALNAAKSFLGINSPSKVFADNVGRAIPEGIAKGVEDHASLAHRAVGSLASSLPVKLASGALGLGGLPLAKSSVPLAPGSYLGGAASQGGGSTIVFDLRGSQVMSERDMDQFVDKIGRRLTTRSLPAGGVRLGM